MIMIYLTWLKLQVKCNTPGTEGAHWLNRPELTTYSQVRGEVKFNPESVFYKLTVRLRGKVM